MKLLFLKALAALGYRKPLLRLRGKVVTTGIWYRIGEGYGNNAVLIAMGRFPDWYKTDEQTIKRVSDFTSGFRPGRFNYNKGTLKVDSIRPATAQEYHAASINPPLWAREFPRF